MPTRAALFTLVACSLVACSGPTDGPTDATTADIVNDLAPDRATTEAGSDAGPALDALDAREGSSGCARNGECAAGMVCSANACVPSGFGFVTTYGDASATADASPLADGAASEWPVVNGSSRGARRSETAGNLTRPAARWRFDTGQSLSASRVAVLDVDGDGASEVVTAEGGGLRARSQGGAELWRTPALGSSVSISSAADLNGDGRPDFTLQLSPPRVVVVSGVDGHLLADQNDFAVGYVMALVVPNLSGDGRPDVVTMAKNLDSPGYFRIRLFALTASGLAQQWQYDEPNGYYGGPVAAVADVDGDGALDLTVHEYALGWFKSFDRAGHVIASGTGPRSGTALYLRDLDGVAATTEMLNAQDRNGVQTDGHELALYQRSGATWTSAWRAYDTDAPPSQPVLSGPWADALEDFDGDGQRELLAGVYDYDAARSASHWSTTMHRARDGMLTGSLADKVPLAVVRIRPADPPAVLTMDASNAVLPPLGTTSFVRWTPFLGAPFTTVWTRSDAAPAIISTRVDVLGPVGVGSSYAGHGAVADIEGDGANEVLLFARGDTAENGDRPGQLLAVSATDGRTVAVYYLAPEDLVEVLAVEGAGDTLRVWISSHQLGILALDRRFTVVRRLQGSGFSPTALTLATSRGPALVVSDSSGVTHLLRADPNSADLVEGARLNHQVTVLAAERSPDGAARLMAQDRNGNHNVLSAFDERADGSLAAAWSFTLTDAESVQVVSRGNFGSPAVPAWLVQLRHELDPSSSRVLALREADGTMLWAAPVTPPRPYVHASLISSAVLSCGGSDHVLSCAFGCQCMLLSGADGTGVGVSTMGGCDALDVAAGRTNGSGDTPFVTGGGAYQTGYSTLHADCTVTANAALASAVQTAPALADSNADAVLDPAYWSDAQCFQVRNGVDNSLLWSRLYVGGAAMPCVVGAMNLRYQPTAAVAGDLDGDGREELLLGSGDGDLLFLSAATGEVGTRVQTRRLLRDPLLADVDGDRRPEVLLGTDDGYLYVFAQSAP